MLTVKPFTAYVIVNEKGQMTDSLGDKAGKKNGTVPELFLSRKAAKLASSPEDTVLKVVVAPVIK
jgi:hypothetical protein